MAIIGTCPPLPRPRTARAASHDGQHQLDDRDGQNNLHGCALEGEAVHAGRFASTLRSFDEGREHGDVGEQ